jgi:gas vesicle protein GvpA/GvpJ/GvpM family
MITSTHDAAKGSIFNRQGDGPARRTPGPGLHPQSQDLADVLERVLDKGVVIAGDISINLLDIELLTIKLRLLIASVDKAQEIGLDWWTADPYLSGRARELRDENRALRDRVERLESRLTSETSQDLSQRVRQEHRSVEAGSVERK